MSEKQKIDIKGDTNSEIWELEAGKDALGDMIDAGHDGPAVEGLAAELRQRRGDSTELREASNEAMAEAHQQIQEAGTAELEGTITGR